jgi:hypothetical protein
MQKLRLILAVIWGDAGPERDEVIQSALDEMREIERRQADARQRLEDAVRLKVITAQRDNIIRRPEPGPGEVADDD